MNSYECKNAYLLILEKEQSSNDILNQLNKWAKKYQMYLLDTAKIQRKIKEVKGYLKNEKDNILLMDKLTSAFLSMSKQIDNNEDAEDSLAEILQNIT